MGTCCDVVSGFGVGWRGLSERLVILMPTAGPRADRRCVTRDLLTVCRAEGVAGECVVGSEKRTRRPGLGTSSFWDFLMVSDACYGMAATKPV